MSTMWKPVWHSRTETAPAIMRSLDSTLDDFDRLTDFNHIYYANRDGRVKSCTKCNNNNNKSFLLLNENENLQVSSVEEFLTKLNCTKENTKVKVVSIFRNAGDRKNHIMNHTMNHVFFEDEKVFGISNQNCCTLGVWAAFDPILNVICLDTEGLQGVTSCENKHTKFLLKVLAISDIVVYGIHSERLDRDLYTFLGNASRSYSHHFKATLQAIGQQEGIFGSLSTFGPSIIVLHETERTKPLTKNESEDILKKKFVQMSLEIDAFSSIKYVGLQTVNNSIDYEQLRSAIEIELNNTTVRSARKPHLVYNMLKNLNDQFCSETENVSNTLFPNQYFTCPVKCLSCNSRCNNSMGHIREGKPHSSDVRCKFQCQYENLIYICKKCYKNGKEIEVNKQYQSEEPNSWYNFAKNAWSGYVIDCSQCGVIYKSRQYWYGNNSEDSVIRKRITHVWNVPSRSIVPQNTAQRVIDSVSYITEAVTNASLQPTKALKAWAADQVAPSYWRSNNEIKHCYQCKILFNLADDKHHCRDCGEGFCDQCSSKTKCVPARNWYSPVRVCDTCYGKEINYSSDDSLEPVEDVGVRKVTEHVVSTLNAVGNVLSYSKSFIKDSVRPTYWIPDSEIVNCNVCERKISAALPLHHCRACGCGVCHECSQHRKPVPHRGWDHPVRVCNACV